MKSFPLEDSDYGPLGAALRRVAFFKDLSLKEVEKIFAYIKRYTFEKGETLFRQGAAPDGFYVLKSGEVDVLRRRVIFLPRRRVRRLGPGQFFGEMALLNRRPRNATVRAATAADAYVLLISDFDRILDQNPAFRDQIKHIAESRQFEIK